MAITWTPARPVAGRPVRGKLSGTGNYARVFIDDVQVYEGEPALASVFWIPDSAGNKAVHVDWYVRGAEQGGGWAGSGWAMTEDLVATEDVTLSVGTRLRQKFGWGDHTGYLVLYAWDNVIQPTTAEEHGEVTPAFESVSSNIAQMAADVCQEWMDGIFEAPINGDPVRALGYTIDLVNGPVWNHTGYTSALPLPVAVQHLFLDIQTHISDITYHAVSSSDELAVPLQPLVAVTSTNDAHAWAVLAAKDVALFQSGWMFHSKTYGYSGESVFEGVGGYHAGTDPYAALQAPAPSSPESVLVALGELVFCWDAHLQNRGIHTGYFGPDVEDPVFDVLQRDIPGLRAWGNNMRGVMRMHYEWAKMIRTQAVPEATTTVNTAAGTLSSLGGFS